MAGTLHHPDLQHHQQNFPSGLQQSQTYDSHALDQFFDADQVLLPESAVHDPTSACQNPVSSNWSTAVPLPPNDGEIGPPHAGPDLEQGVASSPTQKSAEDGHPGLLMAVKQSPGSDGFPSRDSQSAFLSNASSSSAPGGPAPRRRTRRRQNISCDQCRASKRGCDFQLKLDADGNHVSQSGTPADISTGTKRKAAGIEVDDNTKAPLVCSNCQRRGIECTTHFADSVRSSKQQALATKEAENGANPAAGASKKRLTLPDDPVLAARSGSISSEAGSSVEESTRMAWSPGNREATHISLSWSGANGRFADRADSLSLTTDRMRLYVSTVEPNANLWLSRACSPLRTEGDLGAFIKGAVATNALNLSQKLWASWHVDSPSSQRDHQPNLFYLVFGLDHIGEEMSVWTQRVAALPSGTGKSMSASDAQGVEQALGVATKEFHERMGAITGNGPDGWRRSDRDASIDEAVKAAMLAYACQYRLDHGSFPGVSGTTSEEEAKAIEAHDRVATAAWKKARSLLLQLAPRRSCRIAFGLFLFAVTAPPVGALAEGGSTSGTDAADDAAFAFETASRHLEWYIKATRDLYKSVDDASRNPILHNSPQVLRQKRMASDLMGLAESLGWFGLLIDTVSSVSLRRKSVMREDSLLDKASGLDASLFGAYGNGFSPSSSSKSTSSPDNTAAALFAIQETLDLLPGRHAPPGAFPGTSSSYMHDYVSDEDGRLVVDTEMSRRIMERAACARDLIPALLRNPRSISNSVSFDILLGGDAGNGNKGPGSLFSLGGDSGGLNEQVVLLGIAWGTAVEVYIWRRINALQTLSAPLLSATSPINAYILGGGNFVDDKEEKLVDNVLESIRLFHSIFDGLISKALDEYFSLTRQSRSMLAMFVLHIHLGVLHFIRLAKDLELKEVDLVQQFNSLSLGSAPNEAQSIALPSCAPPGSHLDPPYGLTPFDESPAYAGASNAVPSSPSNGFTPVRSKLAPSSQIRRTVGKQAAFGMARVTKLMNLESTHLDRSKSVDASPGATFSSGSPHPVEESGTAPWRHPYPLLLADALRLAAQQLHDEVWDQVLTVPHNAAEFNQTLDHLDTVLDGLARLLHSVPALSAYRQGLDEMRSARDTAAFVATQQRP